MLTEEEEEEEELEPCVVGTTRTLPAFSVTPSDPMTHISDLKLMCANAYI